ncbi:hypothetical protein Tco_1092366 [Tanacetum coccineum]|uniref:Uncharacterized protein n=1 Tax=Tanacetum coccineum TaxID=301880 RepID=A0ABQ5IBV5_9ASTR
MELKSTNSGPTTKLPILKLGEYKMWVIKIKQYFQIQDYALWEVIEKGDSWVSVPQTTQENDTSVTKMSIPVTAKEKTNKKNDVKARGCYSWLFLMNINLHSMNKPKVETMSIDDLYNNFKIIEQKLKKSVGTSSGAQNLAFMTAPSTSSTNDANTASPQRSNVQTPQLRGKFMKMLWKQWIYEDVNHSLLSVRAKKYYQRTGKKIFINANDTAGYDKSKALMKSDMDRKQVQTNNMAQMAFSDYQRFQEIDGRLRCIWCGVQIEVELRKRTLKTDSLDFEDVYFVNELKFNLFSVSQMCNKKNYVLFTDTECLVLSPNFKLPAESQILHKIPKKDNKYSFDMKNIVPKEILTCLVAKATSDESML